MWRRLVHYGEHGCCVAGLFIRSDIRARLATSARSALVSDKVEGDRLRSTSVRAPGAGMSAPQVSCW